jgi:uncharacterized protein (DUF433 family)
LVQLAANAKPAKQNVGDSFRVDNYRMQGPDLWLGLGQLLDGAFDCGPCFGMSPLLSRITVDPNICHGKPTIRNLRYPVESMLEYLAAGDTIEDLLAEYSDLEREDLLACLEFAAQSLKLKSQHLVLS